MNIIVNELLINYEIIGKNKKTILFIHGWGDDHNNLKLAFQELKKNYQLVFLDLPGFGASQRPPLDYDLDKYALVVKEFVSKLGIKVDILITHSFGGSVAIKALSKGYLNVDKLILLASSGIRFTSLKKNRIKKLYLAPAKAMLLPLPKNVQNKIVKGYYKRRGSDLYLREDLMPVFRRIVAEDIRKDATLIKIPTLLIYGEQDQETPIQYGYLLHEAIDHSSLEIITSAGHFVFKDRPERVLKLVQEFL